MAHQYILIDQVWVENRQFSLLHNFARIGQIAEQGSVVLRDLAHRLDRIQADMAALREKT